MKEKGEDNEVGEKKTWEKRTKGKMRNVREKGNEGERE